MLTSHLRCVRAAWFDLSLFFFWQTLSLHLYKHRFIPLYSLDFPVLRPQNKKTKCCYVSYCHLNIKCQQSWGFRPRPFVDHQGHSDTWIQKKLNTSPQLSHCSYTFISTTSLPVPGESGRRGKYCCQDSWQNLIEKVYFNLFFFFSSV